MKFKVYFLFIFVFLFLINFSSAWSNNTFNNSLTVENLSFGGNESFTRWLNIPSSIYSITGATLNLSGYNKTYSCYQEFDNGTNACIANGWNNSYLGTAPNAISDSIYINYTKPYGAVNTSLYQVRHGNLPAYNITLPQACWQQNPIQIKATSVASSTQPAVPTSWFECNNGSAWNLIGTNQSGGNNNNLGGCVNWGNDPKGFYDGDWSSLSYWFHPSGWITCQGERGSPDDVGNATLREEGFFWNYSTPPNNIYLKINNTNVFNQSGEFATLNNITSNFATTLTSYLTATFLSGDNYLIPFIFHSDTQGILEYFDLRFTGFSNPFVSLVSPLNNTVAGQNKTFIANVTDINTLANMTFYLWNSTGSLINKTNFTISGQYNQSSIFVNFSYSDTYNWNWLACNTDPTCKFASNNYSLIVDTLNPVINIESPSNNQWINSANYRFNCTTISSSLDSGFIYANFNGTYSRNQTIKNINSSQTYSFLVNGISDGNYSWTCAVNTTTSSTIYYSQLGNLTLNVDTVYPTISINSITSSVGSQTISANSTSADSHLSTCKYSIFNSTGSIDGLSNNVSFTCNNVFQATVTAYATYNLTVYASDLAGNENSTTQTFTITAQGTTTGGGGGGGSSAAIPVIGLNDINGTVAYSPLQREIIYAVMNNYCSLKVRNQALAVADYSQECTLTQTDLTNVQNNLNTFNVNVPLTDLSRFYQNYKSSSLFQGSESQDTINRYNLFTSVLGLTSLLQLSPPSVDTPVFITFSRNQTYTIVYNVLANKPLAICDVVSEDPNLQCTVQGNSTVRITYLITNPNFLSKIFSGVVTVITDAPADKLEQKRLTVVFRVYNLGYKIAGIPLYLIMILVVVGGIGGSVYFVRKRSKRKGKGLNSLKSILEVGK